MSKTSKELLKEEVFNSVNAIKDNFKLLLAQIAAAEQIGALNEDDREELREFFSELSESAAEDGKIADDLKPDEEAKEAVINTVSSSSDSGGGLFDDLKWYHWVIGGIAAVGLGYAAYSYFSEDFEDEDDTIVIELD